MVNPREIGMIAEEGGETITRRPHFDYPFAGARMPQGLLKAEGYEVGRLHVSTLMKTMGIEALYPTGSTAKCIAGRATTPDQEYLDILPSIPLAA